MMSNSNHNRANNSSQLHDPLNEIANLRCKLDSKASGLVILSQELIEAKRERDEYRALSEQLKHRYSELKRRIEACGPSLTSIYDSGLSNTTLAQILCQLKEQNKALIYELEEVKTKLIESEGDVRLLKEQINSITKFNSNNYVYGYEKGEKYKCEEAKIQKMIEELESFKNRSSLLEKDMESLLDEKEELILARDAYKAKLDRLNEKLNHILSGESSNKGGKQAKIIDIDSLVTENQFLREKIMQTEEEKRILKASLTKYRTLLEKSKSTNSLSIRDKYSLPMDPFSIVISSKQVQEFIASNHLNNLELSQSSLNSLKCLVITLYESFIDKSSALALQKKNNKLLGERLEQLEDKIKELKAKENVFFSKQEDDNYNINKESDKNDFIQPLINKPEYTEDNMCKNMQSNTNNESILPDKLQALLENEMQKLKNEGEDGL